MFNYREEGGLPIGDPFEQTDDGLKAAKEAADLYSRSALGNNKKIEVWWDDEIPIFYFFRNTVGNACLHASSGHTWIDTKSGGATGEAIMCMRTQDWHWCGGPNREMTFAEKEFNS